MPVRMPETTPIESGTRFRFKLDEMDDPGTLRAVYEVFDSYIGGEINETRALCLISSALTARTARKGQG